MYMYSHVVLCLVKSNSVAAWPVGQTAPRLYAVPVVPVNTSPTSLVARGAICKHHISSAHSRPAVCRPGSKGALVRPPCPSTVTPPRANPAPPYPTLPHPTAPYTTPPYPTLRLLTEARATEVIYLVGIPFQDFGRCRPDTPAK